MGRTNPTFRDALSSVRGDWDRYRRGLRREHKDAFDALFADAEAHADAAGHLNAREPMHPILVSMLLEQKLTIRDLQARVADLESALAERDATRPEHDAPHPERDASHPEHDATHSERDTAHPGHDATLADNDTTLADDDPNPEGD